MSQKDNHQGLHWGACHDCDYLYHLPIMEKGERAVCPRCGSIIDERKNKSIELASALSIAALILFIVANSFAFLKLELQGQITETSLLTGAFQLFMNNKPLLAGLVILTIFIAPLIQLCIFLYVLIPLQLGYQVKYAAVALRFLEWLSPWSMIDVFMLGILVAIVKLASMATIMPGVAIWSFAILIVVLAAANSVLDTRQIWHIIEEGRE